MPACMWLKVNGPAHRGAFAAPMDWDDNGAPVPEGNFVDRRGAPILRRVPALGYEGDDIRRMHPIRGVRRYIDHLVESGHILPITQTNAAAHVPDEDNSYQRDRAMKARYFGWIEWPSTGRSVCPMALVQTGERRVQQMMAKGNRQVATTDEERAEEAAVAEAWRGEPLASPRWWGTPCPVGHTGPRKGPCIHAVAERIARRAIRAKDEADRAERHKTEEARNAEQQTVALTDLARTLAAVVGTSASALAPAPEPDPPKGAKR